LTLLFDPEVRADEFAGSRVTIIGLGKGRTTAGLARFLVRKGAHVTIADPKPREELAEGVARLGDLPVELKLGPSSDDEALADPDFVFVIPGIRPRSPTILRALEQSVPVLTEMALFFRLCPATIVGITGTKGKTTTTTLIERVLALGPRPVLVGGNIGHAVIQEVDRLTRNDIVVLELSSFQLETLGHSPHVAVVTNVLEDHLDHHGTRDAYVAAKRNIVAWQGPRDIAVLNFDDPTTVALHTGAASEVRGFSLVLRPKRGAYLDDRGQLVLASRERRDVLCAANELRVPGRHNVANALAAAIVGDAFDIPADRMGVVLREFEGVPRRLESASTTPAATIAALDAFADRPAVVILGGVAKGADFGQLAREVTLRARAAVLIGQAADEIGSALDAAAAGGRRIPVRQAGSLADAVSYARDLARPGDVVLLSPACAARTDLVTGEVRGDQFSSADERGERFTALVRAFAEPVAS